MELKCCRLCQNTSLKTVLDLGEQELSGVFPKVINQKITKGNIGLVWCSKCSLLQLNQSYNLDEMFGDNYGYRSSLNVSMVRHLTTKMRWLESFASPLSEDLVIDIGSNDATSLKAYQGDFEKVGVDPTGTKFAKYYTEDIKLLAEFFSYDIVNKNYPGRKARIITSIAMFYDLERPLEFVKDIEKLLHDEGIWHFEQSYMPLMLQTLSYDTICHEHLEFYSLSVINNMLKSAGLRIIDVELNEVNGGSFAVTACKENAYFKSNKLKIDEILQNEAYLNSVETYLDFARNVAQHKTDIIQLLTELKKQGKVVAGYGASTKGNILLNYCGITSELIPFIAEVNEDKFGSFTPGTLIPIVSEKEALARNPDYYFVLPWHFKNPILQKEQEFIKRGGKFIFPLPKIEIV